MNSSPILERIDMSLKTRNQKYASYMPYRDDGNSITRQISESNKIDYSDTGYEGLACAIARQVFTDLKREEKRNNEDEINKLKNYLLSNDFQTMTHLDGQYLLSEYERMQSNGGKKNN